MNSPPNESPSSSTRLFWISCAASAVFVLCWAVANLSESSLWTYCVFLIPFWLTLMTSVLVVHRLLKKWIERIPEMIYPRRLSWMQQGRLFWTVCIAWLVCITLVREGAFLPLVSYEFSWRSSSTNASSKWSLSTSSRSSSWGPGGDAPKALFSKGFVLCHVQCSAPGAVCEGFEANISCDGTREDQVPEGRQVTHVTIRLEHAGDPFCYTPLWKSMTLPISVSGDLRTENTQMGGSASKETSLNGTSTLERSTRGIVSCRSERLALGAMAAKETAGMVNDAISRK